MTLDAYRGLAKHLERAPARWDVECGLTSITEVHRTTHLDDVTCKRCLRSRRAKAMREADE